MLETLAQGIVLGVSLAAPPGPVNAMIASRSLRSWIKGAFIGFGALTADLIFMTVTIFVGSIVPQEIIPEVSLAGGGFLAWLAYGTFQSKEVYTTNDEKKFAGTSYFTGLAMGLTNPFQIMWWMSVGVSLARNFGLEIFIGFVFGVVVWVLSFSFLINKFGFSQVFVKAVKLFSTVTLLAFSAYLIFYGIKGLF